MTDKSKLKGLRPLLPATFLTTPLMTLSPVIGACNSNRIYRAEEATAPTEAQTASPLIPAPPGVLFPQPAPIVPLLSLSTDPTDRSHPDLPSPLGGPLPPLPTGLLQALAGTPPTNLKGARETLPEPHRDFTEPHQAFPEPHRDVPSPLAFIALTSETQQRPYEVAFQTSLAPLDLNQDNVVNSQDFQVLYYLALDRAPTNLEALLNNLNVPDLSATRLVALRALDLSTVIRDLNNDNVIDLQDVRVLYYAYRFGELLRASPSLREALLGDLTTEDDVPGADRDGVYLSVLDRVVEVVSPIPEGDHAFQVIEGASYTLSTDDLSVRDSDDTAATLTWIVTDAPDNGQLELSTAPGMAITPDMSFTQQQLEDGEVVYVHDGSNTLSDGFTLRVADDEGARSDPVMLNIDIAHILENIDLTELAPADGFIIQGDVAGDYAGLSVSGAGDVNGDGYADLLVGAPFGDDGGDDAGEAYLVFGSADSSGRRVVDLTNLAVADGFIIQGDKGGYLDEAGDNAGISVSGAGDVNGDGYADLLVGANYGDDGGRNAGEAYLVFGKAAGPSDPFGSPDAGGRRVVDLISLSAQDGFIIQGDSGEYGGGFLDEDGDNAGISVSGAGDVNGDGYADLLVGAWIGDDGGTNAGEAYLVFGKAGGPSDPFGSAVITRASGSPMTRQVIDLTSLAAEDGFVIRGDADRDNAGISVSGAGDVNGDGYADLIIGASTGNDGGTNAGEAYVVFGRAFGFGNAVTTREDGVVITRQVIDLTGLAAEDGFIIRGDMDGDNAGVSVSGAGDVNGDGYADLIVGAFRGNDGGRDAGEAYVVFGKADGFGSADGSGRRVIDLSGLTAADGFIIRGDAALDRAGISVAGAGDVNGDGYADLLVGAPFGDAGGINAGEAYVVFGKAADPSNPFGSADSSGRRVIDLTGLTAAEGLIIRGDVDGDLAGVSVAGAGDVNGDGYADLLVGAFRGDDGGGDAGEAYVLFGGPAGLSTEAAAVSGTDSDDVLNADGVATVVLAGAGDDVLTVDGFGDTDLLKFDGGSGTDTLRLVNPDASPGLSLELSLDLSTLADTRLSSIEHIDLSGSLNNSLRLSGLDLLSLSEVRTKSTEGAEGRAVLRVDGDAGDRLSTVDGWVRRGTEEIDETTYGVFDNGNARLLVNMAIDVSGVDAAPTAVTLTPLVTTLAETDDTGTAIKVADIAVTDVDAGPRGLELTGADAARFQLNPAGTELLLRAGAELNFETNPALDVSVRVAANPSLRADLMIPVRDQNDVPITGGDATFTLLRGTDYTLLTNDLSAMDEDDDITVLTWTVETEPMHGQLELSTNPGTKITSFTQAQLFVGAVVYVHGDRNTDRDSFTVRVRDDQNAPAVAVTLDVGIQRAIDMGSLAVTDGFIIQGDAGYDQAGGSVSGAGDVNGDGYADLIVGAPRAAGLAGEAYVVFGKASDPSDPFGSPDSSGRRVIDLTGLGETDGFIIQGDAVDDQAGVSVSDAGDVNGDGYADLIVGAGLGKDGGSNAGEAYVVFGGSSGFGSADSSGRRVIDLTDLAAENGFIIQGDVPGDFAGGSVSGAGDVNGDGYADLLVAAVGGDDGGALAGEVYVVFGKASGFGSADSSGRRVIDLTGLAPADGFIIQGDTSVDFAGVGVSSAGDVNGDGYTDLIVGANRGDDGGRDAGEAYVVFGKASDSSDPFGSLDSSGRRVIDLTSLAVEDGFIIRGDAEYNYAGMSVSGAGDVNGDGFADLIVGAPRGNEDESNASEAYVLFGKASDPSDPQSNLFGSEVISTVVGEGTFRRQVIDLTELAPEDGFLIRDDANREYAGFSVSVAGDVNGDGYADLLVGAPRADVSTPDSTRTNAGEVYLVFGKASGFGSPVVTILADGRSVTRQVIDLTELAAEDGFIIQGDAPGDFAGRSVSGAGDVNGDGFADLIVGAPFGDDGGNFAGEAYVLFGAPAGLATEAGAVLGTDGNDLLLNVDGAATVVLAGAGNDVLNIDGFGDTDLLKFDGGGGTDTLRLVNPGAGTDLSLDLSTLADTRLSSIEHIDLSGSGGADNSLTLTRLDLLNLSEVRTNGRAELRVDGNTGDSVTAPDDGWARSADVMIGSTMYRAFDNGNARLLVNMDVSLGGNLMATSLATVAELLQNCCVTQTVDIRAFIEDLPPEDEEQQRKRMEDELAMLGPLPAAKAAMDLAATNGGSGAGCRPVRPAAADPG